MDRLIRLQRLSDSLDFALKRSGVLVERAPLAPKSRRKLTLFLPVDKSHMPGTPAEIAARKADPATDVIATLTRTRKNSHTIQGLQSPEGARKTGAAAPAIAKLRKALLDHADRRGITLRGYASAYAGETIPTKKLVEHYKRHGFKPDPRPLRDAITRNPERADFLREHYGENYVPVKRTPKR